MTLQDEIETASANINTDAYAMSIGEVVNLYRDRELVIRPAFQRLFRWSTYQKSRLIESILLGIPIPSIFVSQRDDGVWEVVDGLQRLSTILEFVGELTDEAGNRRSPSVLVGTKYLPDLENRTFDTGAVPLEQGQRIAFKRSKLDIKIVKEAAEAKTKYDLFDRLNSGGSILSDQEFRNSLIVMSNPSFMDWLEALRTVADFQLSVAPSDKQSDEQYDLELVVRFLVLTNRTEESLSQFRDLRELLTDAILAYAEDDHFAVDDQGDRFRRTFRALNAALNGSAFRRYDADTDRFLGGFSVSAFEVVSVGVASNLELWETATGEQLKAKVGSVWSHPDFLISSGMAEAESTRRREFLARWRSAAPCSRLWTRRSAGRVARRLTKEGLVDSLDADMGWRRLELSAVRTSLSRAAGPAEATAARTAVTLAYAHWEGYVVTTGRALLSYVAALRLKYEDLSDSYVALCLAAKLGQADQSIHRIQRHIDVVTAMRRSAEQARFPAPERAIHGEGNLKSAKFDDIVTRLALDPRPFELHYNWLDWGLLRRRNNIAHGQSEHVDPDFALEALEIVDRLVDSFRTAAQNAAVLEVFRR